MTQYTRILCLGDSITFGARSTHGRTYPSILEHHLASNAVPSVVLNAGVNGETSWQIVERSWAYIGDDPWLRVCVCIMGTNDSKPKHRTPYDFYLQSWERLHRYCQLTDTILFACEIPAINPTGQPEYDAGSMLWIAGANTALARWAAHASVPFIDGLHDTFSRSPGLLADGIHPTNEGNEAIAMRVLSVIGQPMPYSDDESSWSRNLAKI